MSMMDAIFGFVGADFAVVVADTSNARSVVIMKDDLDKIKQLDKHKLLGMAGEISDIMVFSEYVQKNVHLYELRTGIPLNTAAVANFVRTEVAQALRQSSGAYRTNMVLVGVDPGEGPSLYYIDYLGTMHKTNFAAQGLAPYFLLSTFDRYWKPGMTVDEAKKLIQMCIEEVQRRIVVKQVNYIVKLVDANGVRVLDLNEA